MITNKIVSILTFFFITIYYVCAFRLKNSRSSLKSSLFLNRTQLFNTISHGRFNKNGGSNIAPLYFSEQSIHYDSWKSVQSLRVATYLYSSKLPVLPSRFSPLKIIIAGAPAAGKGTQCEVIKEQFGVIHLSTGDILRAAVKAGTELGVKAKEYMDGGKLVPDELITGVVVDRLSQEDCQTKGWLLDGFPRTKAQADALTEAGMIPDSLVLLDVPEKVLVERVTGRRTDPVTGKIYHMKFNPPESEEVASRLVQRSDDTEEKIVIRYKDYQANIDAIKSSYNDKMIWIDGSVSQEQVSSCVKSSLDSVVSDKIADVKNPFVSSRKISDSSSMKIIIAGAPAAGKGTQCELIKERYGVIHLSTGDILRAAVNTGTDLGVKAKEYMDGGKLVPDELITGVVVDRLSQEDCQTKGWLLDGFPRTKAQADALTEAGMIPDCLVLLDVPEKVLVERVTGRRTDPVTGKIYHMKFNPPESEEIASRLVQRSDDTEEKIVIRYKDYQANIDAIKSSYNDKMIWIDGSVSQEQVGINVISSLDALVNKKV